MRHIYVLGLMLLVAACADEGEDGAGEGTVAEGYVRFQTPPVDLAPGESAQFKTWVADPVDYERDILDITGWQGLTGHHAVLYSTTEEQPLGTNRVWSDFDQIDTNLLGGIGGEGGMPIALPLGAVFRVPAGLSLVIQTHYQNSGDRAVGGTFSYLDVKFDAPSDDRIVAGFFAHSTRGLTVPPGTSELDLSCVIPRDLPMLMWVNHVHEWGTDIKTTLVIDGEERVLKDDLIWNAEWITNPNYQKFTAEEPFVIPAGSTLKTHCAWNNDTGADLVYPEEMCVFLGNHSLGADYIACVDGNFVSR